MTQALYQGKLYKVFRLPDGKGGIDYSFQSQDGVWHDCDENGNLLEKKNNDFSQNPTMSFSFRNPKEYRMFRKFYCYCRLKGRIDCSRSEMIVKILMKAVRKDKDFKAFNDSLNEEG